MKKLVPAIIFILSVCIYATANTSFDNQMRKAAEKDKITANYDSQDQNEDYKTEPESFTSKTERWNKEMCVYSNFQYGFAVRLPKNIVWWLTTGTSKHTVVKFAQPHTNMVLFANIQEVNESVKNVDLWNQYENMKNYITGHVVQYVNNNSKENIKDMKLDKVIFCGKHALKQQYTAIVSDDRYEEPEIYCSMGYIVIRENYIYTFTVKCHKDVYEEMQKDGLRLEDWLKCFSMIPFTAE